MNSLVLIFNEKNKKKTYIKHTNIFLWSCGFDGSWVVNKYKKICTLGTFHVAQNQYCICSFKRFFIYRCVRVPSSICISVNRNRLINELNNRLNYFAIIAVACWHDFANIKGVYLKAIIMYSCTHNINSVPNKTHDRYRMPKKMRI